MAPSLRIALVSPRLEPVSAVGAERRIVDLAAGLAERGHRTEILTTCVRDPVTGKNHYVPGRYEDGTCPVVRFPADPRRVTRRALEAAARIRRGGPVGAGDEEAWAGGLGSSAALERHLAEAGRRFDAFLFAPLLCGTTLGGLPAVASRALLIPALPDGPEARLPLVTGCLREAAALLAGSGVERDLLASVAGIEPGRIPVGASGVRPWESYDPEGFRARHGIEVPFLLYTGRRSPAKGVDRLAAFALSAFRNGGIDFRLVLAGEETLPLPEGAGDCILDLHHLGDQDRADGLAAALAYCQPSSREGLALSPLEAWLAGRPVLADGGGRVTGERCRRSGGGLWYGNAREFEEALRLLLEDDGRAARLGAQGRAFVSSSWPWEKTLNAVEESCAELAGGRR